MLWFGPREIKAHKIVLSQASDYLSAAFESEVRTAKSPLLKLQEDGPVAVRGMIAFIYGLHYDGLFGYVRSKPVVTCNGVGFRYVVYLIDLYVIAGKYLATGLQHSIASDLRRQLCLLAQATVFIVEIAKRCICSTWKLQSRCGCMCFKLRPRLSTRLRARTTWTRSRRAVSQLSWELLLKAGQDNEEWRMLASQDS